MTGSEEILKRRNIRAFDKPLTRTERQMENFYSSYPNPEGEENTLRMDQLLYASQWGPEEAVKREG